VLYPGAPYLFGISEWPVVDLDLPGQWIDRGVLTHAPRMFATAVPQADGTFFIPGGSSGPLSNVAGQATSEAYDPRTRTWTPGPLLVNQRALHTVTALDGLPLRTGSRLLLTGGLDAAANLPQLSAEIYTYDADPARRGFSAAPSMSVRRFGHSATRLPDGRVFIAGGLEQVLPQGLTSSTPTTEIFDPIANTWSIGPSMSKARAGHTAHLLTAGPHAGKVLLVGGLSWDSFLGSRIPRFLTECEIYDPGTNSMRSGAAMAGNAGRGLHNALDLPSGDILVVGGLGNVLLGGTPLNTAEIYEPATNTWTAGGVFALARALGGLALLRDGTVLFAGGATGSLTAPTPTTECTVFDPATRTWARTTPMHVARASLVLLSLPGCVPCAVSGSGMAGMDSCEVFYR
jgi:hypothetical protein